MLALSIAAFGLLLFLAYRAGGSLLFPPALLSATWFASLLAIWLWGGFLFPVQPLALTIYVVGATAFTLGGVAVLAFWPLDATDGSPPPTSRWSLKALDGMLVALAVGLPFYWRAMTEGLEGIDAASLLVNIRAAQVELSDQSRSVSLVLNLNVLAQFLAIALFYEANGSFRRRWRAALGVALALVYGAMSGTKGNAVTLLLTLAFVSSIRAQRIQAKMTAIIVAAALVIFSTGILLVNLAAPEIVDMGETANVVAEQVVVYWLGGLVSFGDIAANPNGMASTAGIGRFFLESARSLGMAVEVPPRHAEFTMISPILTTNVYTGYFSYFKDPGWAGMVLIMCVLGGALTLLFRSAMHRGPVARLVFATLCTGIVLSVMADFFFAGLNQLIKFTLFLLFIYRVLPTMEMRRRAVSSADHA